MSYKIYRIDDYCTSEFKALENEQMFFKKSLMKN